MIPVESMDFDVSEKDTHFRISYATSDEKLEQGIDILGRLA